MSWTILTEANRRDNNECARWQTWLSPNSFSGWWFGAYYWEWLSRYLQSPSVMGFRQTFLQSLNRPVHMRNRVGVKLSMECYDSLVKFETDQGQKFRKLHAIVPQEVGVLFYRYIVDWTDFATKPYLSYDRENDCGCALESRQALYGFA